MKNRSQMLKTILLTIGLFATLPTLSIKNLILIAAPGSGKGTLSQYLTQKYDYVQICPGDLFRAEIIAQTELGRQIQPIVERGEYVDECVTCDLIAKHLIQAIQQQKPFIIDGFPRTKSSLDFLTNLLKKHNLTKQVCFVQLLAQDVTCINRIVNRQVCNKCFKVYNRQTIPTLSLSHCDQCHTPLAIRTADTQQIAIQRLNYFHTQIEPLFAQLTDYEKHQIDATQPLATLYAIYDHLIIEQSQN